MHTVHPAVTRHIRLAADAPVDVLQSVSSIRQRAHDVGLRPQRTSRRRHKDADRLHLRATRAHTERVRPPASAIRATGPLAPTAPCPITITTISFLSTLGRRHVPLQTAAPPPVARSFTTSGPLTPLRRGPVSCSTPLGACRPHASRVARPVAVRSRPVAVSVLPALWVDLVVSAFVLRPTGAVVAVRGSGAFSTRASFSSTSGLLGCCSDRVHAARAKGT